MAQSPGSLPHWACWQLPFLCSFSLSGKIFTQLAMLSVAESWTSRSLSQIALTHFRSFGPTRKRHQPMLRLTTSAGIAHRMSSERCHSWASS